MNMIMRCTRRLKWDKYACIYSGLIPKLKSEALPISSHKFSFKIILDANNINSYEIISHPYP